jgi:signal transduction histidine kinase
MPNLPSSDSDPRDLSHAEISLFAHELRNALTVIAGYTALLRHPLAEKERAAALDGIERAIARADSMCGDALEGRAPAPSKARVREPVSINELAEQASADQHSATGRDVAVHAVAADGELVVIGDGQALARVLGNLVSNGDKYSPDGASLDVSVTREIRPFLGDAAIVEVADRGPGIPAEMRDLVFEPFERLERDEQRPGTGLGLAIVKNVVTAHDGRVRILEREGGGTIVRVELPAEAARR